MTLELSGIMPLITIVLFLLLTDESLPALGEAQEQLEAQGQVAESNWSLEEPRSLVRTLSLVSLVSLEETRELACRELPSSLELLRPGPAARLIRCALAFGSSEANVARLSLLPRPPSPSSGATRRPRRA